MGTRSEVEAALPELRRKCEAVASAYGSADPLTASLGGVYFAFKAVKFVARVHDELMADPTLVNRGNGDEAGYFAEAMVRSVHSSGDLLATAIVECGHAVRPTRRDGTPGDTFLSNLTYSGLAAGELKPKVDALMASPVWKYVQAFTNTSKHNAFIDRTSVRTGNEQEIVFASFSYKGSSQPERTFGEVLVLCLEVLRSEEAVLDWLLASASPSRNQMAPPAGVEYRVSPITATFTPPSAASFLRRTYSPPRDDDPA